LDYYYPNRYFKICQNIVEIGSKKIKYFYNKKTSPELDKAKKKWYGWEALMPPVLIIYEVSTPRTAISVFLARVRGV
jgi:hypothetical protein